MQVIHTTRKGKSILLFLIRTILYDRYIPIQTLIITLLRYVMLTIRLPVDEHARSMNSVANRLDLCFDLSTGFVPVVRLITLFQFCSEMLPDWTFSSICYIWINFCRPGAPGGWKKIETLGTRLRLSGFHHRSDTQKTTFLGYEITRRLSTLD